MPLRKSFDLYMCMSLIMCKCVCVHVQGMGGSAGSRAAAVAAAGESVLATLQAALKRANESHKHTKQTLQRTTVRVKHPLDGCDISVPLCGA